MVDRNVLAVVLLASVAVLAPSAPLHAQGDRDAAERAGIADILVTARRTEERLQDAPVSVRAILDAYNREGSTSYVNSNTSQARYETDPNKCHINWCILDSSWEGEFCRVVERHPRVLAYVKNHNLGFEVPYRAGSEVRRYRLDFIVRIDDGHGPDGRLNLLVEVKGFRGEDAKDKALTMENWWVPGINNLKRYGRWDFAEFTDVYAMQSDFEALVEMWLAGIITVGAG